MFLEVPSLEKIGLFNCIFRGIRRRCPRCGQGRLFRAWYRLGDQCSRCDLLYLADPVDILAFMYISTALLTGAGVLLMFLWVPQNLFWGRVLVGGVALGTILLTMPLRKGFAIGLEYWIRSHFGPEK